MDCLYRGFDQLDVAFKGALPERVRVQLRLAKRSAKENGEPHPFTMGGLSGLVKPDGARGGYAFVFDTGEFGEFWLFKDNGDSGNWNIFVQVRSMQLATGGYYAAKDRIHDSLKAFGVDDPEESLNRVDFAMDYDLGPNFKLRPDHVVCHSGTGVRVDHGKEGEGLAYRVRGRRCESVTVGKMPGRQIIIYDKRREQVALGRTGWFELWGVTKESCPPVWRVEVRAGKKHLTDWNIRTFEDLENGIGDVFSDALKRVRLVKTTQVTNISRAPSEPVWDAAAEVVRCDLSDHSSGIDRGRVVKARREDISTMVEAQIRGCAATLSVALGIPKKFAREKVLGRLQDALNPRGENPQFNRAYQKAADRYVWMGEEPPPFDDFDFMDILAKRRAHHAAHA